MSEKQSNAGSTDHFSTNSFIAKSGASQFIAAFKTQRQHCQNVRRDVGKAAVNGILIITTETPV